MAGGKVNVMGRRNKGRLEGKVNVDKILSTSLSVKERRQRAGGGKRVEGMHFS